jgi:hypothetical protein
MKGDFDYWLDWMTDRAMNIFMLISFLILTLLIVCLFVILIRLLISDNPEHRPEPFAHVPEQLLFPGKPRAPCLDFLKNGDGDCFPGHAFVDGYAVKTPEVGRSARPPVEGAGVVNENVPVFKMCYVPRPAHTGVDTEPPFVRREACEIRSDKTVFRLSHVPSVTSGGGKVKA